MDTVKIRVYYDFASTLCYVAHHVLESVKDDIDDIGVQLEWRPIDLTEAAPGAAVVTVPLLSDDVHDLDGLQRIADLLTATD